MKERIERIREKLNQENLDLLLVTSLPNIRYLCGFTGSNGILLISKDKAVFLTDFRYKEQVKKEVKGAEIKIAQKELFSFLPEINLLKGKRIKAGFEEKYLTFQLYQRLKTLLPQVLWVPTENLVESLLVTKDEDEIKKIAKAADISAKAYQEILPFLRPGTKESDIAAELEYRIKRNGGTGSAFEPIVASGLRSAMPHARASSKTLKKGEFVTLDFGASYDGYVCDITRTVVLGNATPRQKKIYNLVLKAQTRAIEEARSGMKGFELDRKARDIIKKAGYQKYFGHGLGHGIGLLVHDSPGINTKSQEVLKPGMVITIEPGVYIPGWGGVRIEDDVLITRNGCKILTHIDRELLEIS
ncbi:MAG: Xaa-Pro peptidase family protein [candidate division Zixibacteria bacterium]|nr:Xaa-Pro peptidase family protein [candidate division Zixibacteria bacterium]